MSKLNIKPLADRVLVEPLEAETKTASGIIIPDTAKEKPQKGNVVAVGAVRPCYMVSILEQSSNMKVKIT
jgi:co-chaperonin GroES (HSP10)